jgi:hypothetical protein
VRGGERYALVQTPRAILLTPAWFEFALVQAVAGRLDEVVRSANADALAWASVLSPEGRGGEQTRKILS